MHPVAKFWQEKFWQSVKNQQPCQKLSSFLISGFSHVHDTMALTDWHDLKKIIYQNALCLFVNLGFRFRVWGLGFRVQGIIFEV